MTIKPRSKLQTMCKEAILLKNYPISQHEDSGIHRKKSYRVFVHPLAFVRCIFLPVQVTASFDVVEKQLDDNLEEKNTTTLLIYNKTIIQMIAVLIVCLTIGSWIATFRPLYCWAPLLKARLS